MATVTEIYENNRLHFENGVGVAYRNFTIEGLSATNNTNDLLAQAISTSGIPALHSAHPNISNMYVATHDVMPLAENPGSTSRTGVKVIVGYSTPTGIPLGGVKVRISSSNGQFTLNRWPSGPNKGLPIFIGYSPTKGVSFPSQITPDEADPTDQTNISTSSTYDYAEFAVESPNIILELSRTEYTYPRQVEQYRRRLNSNAWLGFAPLTVLLKYVSAENIIGAGVIAPSFYVVTYQFEIAQDPSQWVRASFKRDQFTGSYVPGINLNDQTYNGYTFVTPYDTADFNGLKFPNNTLA